MKYEDCIDCQNFIPHYGIDKGRGAFRIYCGHCKKFTDAQRKKLKLCSELNKEPSLYFKQEYVTELSTLIAMEYTLVCLNKNLKQLKNKIKLKY